MFSTTARRGADCDVRPATEPFPNPFPETLEVRIVPCQRKVGHVGAETEFVLTGIEFHFAPKSPFDRLQVAPTVIRESGRQRT